MQAGDGLALAAFGVSVVAVAISVAAVVYARRATLAGEAQARAAESQLRLSQAQDRERRLSQNRAQLRATLERFPGHGRLTVRNDGAAPADDVQMHVSVLPGTPPGMIPMIFQHVTRTSRLAAGASAQHGLVTFDGMPDRYRVVLTWTNVDGTPGEWESEVSLHG